MINKSSKPMPIVDYINRMNHLYGNGSAPENKTSAVKTTADDIKYNSTTGKIYNKDPNVRMSQKAIKDGLGNNVKDYIFNPAENKFEHKDDLVHESPLPSNMEREPKIHTPAYRRKYPERYGHHYTSKFDQAAYPKAGTAPSERRDHFKHFSKTGKFLEPTQEEIKRAKAPSTWDLIKQTAKTPQEKKEIRQIINEQYDKNPKSLSKDEWKYVDRDKIKPVKIFDNLDPSSYLSNEDQRRAVLTPEKFTKPPQYPEVRLAVLPEIDPSQKVREAALERTREYAFSKIPDPDAVKGIGSFKNTIGQQLRAANSKNDWERNNLRTYKDNHYGNKTNE